MKRTLITLFAAVLFALPAHSVIPEVEAQLKKDKPSDNAPSIMWGYLQFGYYDSLDTPRFRIRGKVPVDHDLMVFYQFSLTEKEIQDVLKNAELRYSRELGDDFGFQAIGGLIFTLTDEDYPAPHTGTFHFSPAGKLDPNVRDQGAKFALQYRSLTLWAGAFNGEIKRDKDDHRLEPSGRLEFKHGPWEMALTGQWGPDRLHRDGTNYRAVSAKWSTNRWTVQHTSAWRSDISYGSNTGSHICLLYKPGRFRLGTQLDWNHGLAWEEPTVVRLTAQLLFKWGPKSRVEVHWARDVEQGETTWFIQIQPSWILIH